MMLFAEVYNHAYEYDLAQQYWNVVKREVRSTHSWDFAA